MTTTARLRVPFDWTGATYNVLLSKDETGGTVGLFENICPPKFGPPIHLHHGEDETLYVLSGEIRVWVEGEETTLSAGQSAYISRGTQHAFRVIGDEPCHFLAFITPGGFENFFMEMANGDIEPMRDMDRMMPIAKSYNLEFTGPELADA